VHARPGARREGLDGMHGERLKVRTTAPPEAGRANARLAAILAEALGLPRRDVELASGASSPRKEFLLRGLALDEARRRLEAALAAAAPAGRAAPEERG
jgi:hypothetical protein